MDSPTQTGREAHTAREASSAIERLTRKAETMLALEKELG